jgi:hypothetical protein
VVIHMISSRVILAKVTYVLVLDRTMPYFFGLKSSRYDLC